MNKLTPSILPGLVKIAQPGDLPQFCAPECAALLWQQALPADVQTWVEGLDPQHLPQMRDVVPRQDIAQTLRALFSASDLPPCPERDWVESHMGELSKHFADLLSTTFIRLRLSVVTNDSCRKFHLDAISARLICTYRGPGTQLGISDKGQQPTRTRTVPTGTPLLLRGLDWPPHPDPGLRHRSPPIEDSEEVRWVFVVDPMDKTHE